MADIALTAAQIAPLFPAQAEIYTFIAGVALTAGKPVAVNSSGKAIVADASASGTAGFRGVALHSAAVGQAIDVLKQGHVAGYTVSGVAYDAPLYLSDTDAGALADAAGTVSVQCARVVPLSDASLTKVVYIDADW